MTNIRYVRARHSIFWWGFMVLSNIPIWWSLFFKPMQRAASVSVTKDTFTPTNPNLKKLVSKYGLNTKLSLAFGSIVECFYKNTDKDTTNLCINTATLKYISILLCETTSTLTALPSYITKPSCFSLGTLLSSAYKLSFKNETITKHDVAFALISSATRASEYFLPQRLKDTYQLDYDDSFYLTSLFEGSLSALYSKYIVNNTKPQVHENLTCPNLNFVQNYTEVYAYRDKSPSLNIISNGTDSIYFVGEQNCSQDNYTCSSS